MEAIRTIYSPNPIPTPFSNIKIVVDTLEVKEVVFTLVTNKKSKRKAKVSFLPPTDSKSKILLVLRTLSIPKTVTASTALKLATTCYSLAITAIITSKPAQPQNRSLLVFLASKPKPKVKLFAQVAKANISSPKFTSASSYENFLHLLQLKKAFSNLSQTTIISIYQVSLGVVRASQGSPSCSVILRTLKMMIQEPTRYQILILLALAAAKIVVANTASTDEFCNKSLVSTYSKLRVESVYKAQDGVSMSTNSIVSTAELKVIKQ